MQQGFFTCDAKNKRHSLANNLHLFCRLGETQLAFSKGNTYTENKRTDDQALHNPNRLYKQEMANLD